MNRKCLLVFFLSVASICAQRPPAGGQIAGVSGNGNISVTSLGAQTPGSCVAIDGNGNHVATGVPCRIIVHQSQLANVPTNGTDQTLFSTTILANTMGAGGCIHVEFVFAQTAGGGTSKFWFGATSVVIYPASGDTSAWTGSVSICNNTAATNAQQIVATPVAYAGANFLAWFGGAFTTAAADTTGAVVVKLTGTGGVSNAYTPISWTVY
jgi:hypothetical protein